VESSGEFWRGCGDFWRILERLLEIFGEVSGDF
jgi:hypothetical protein